MGLVPTLWMMHIYYTIGCPRKCQAWWAASWRSPSPMNDSLDRQRAHMSSCSPPLKPLHMTASSFPVESKFHETKAWAGGRVTHVSASKANNDFLYACSNCVVNGEWLRSKRNSTEISFYWAVYGAVALTRITRHSLFPLRVQFPYNPCRRQKQQPA